MVCVSPGENFYQFLIDQPSSVGIPEGVVLRVGEKGLDLFVHVGIEGLPVEVDHQFKGHFQVILLRIELI